ncbi:MAG TPA: DUF1223 domain-containing protein [Gammaproteobacteria bacterium]|nr:DUF1223 domain-containing protein [Gammaproteobacteria bacterium]
MRWSNGLSLVAALSLSANVLAAPQTIAGSAKHVSLLELYTSEGCNSCPPAEEWISRLQQDGHLWTQLVPVTFHVDYWDNDGWKDPFDSHSYTERQQAIAAQASSLTGKVIYTPEFVLDGVPTRPGSTDKAPLVNADAKIGPLSLTADGRKVTVQFAPTQPRGEALEIQVVLLAFGVDIAVGAGENKGVTLRHDFLVVSDTTGTLTKGKDGNYQSTLTLPAPVAVKARRYALAAWVSAAGSPLPIQSAGGWLAAAP